MHNTQETLPPFDGAFPPFAQTLCNKMLPIPIGAFKSCLENEKELPRI